MEIAVILGSTRTKANPRLGERVAKYVMNEAGKAEGAKFRLLDLVSYDLPIFNGKMPPLRDPEQEKPENVGRWLSDVAEADGFVVLTTEYNQHPPPALLNAFDYITHDVTPVKKAY